VGDLRLGQTVQAVFGVYDKKLSTFVNKNGTPGSCLLCVLGDKTGRIQGVCWSEPAPNFELLTVDGLVMISGTVQEYKGNLQIGITQFQSAADGFDIADFVPSVAADRADLWQQTMGYVASINEPHLAELVAAILGDEAIATAFRGCPAGKEMHHAAVGGLMQHSLEVCKYAETIALTQGTYINRDLLIAGALLHDIGKIEEYDWRSLSFRLTDRGRLMGHLVMGAEMVRGFANSIPGFPTILAMELEHMILSHHGHKEWGSPEEPKTATAYALHLADLLSARMGQVERLLQSQNSTERWTAYDRGLETALWLPEDKA
jgi:3'-5' exoribonuclease